MLARVGRKVAPRLLARRPEYSIGRRPLHAALKGKSGRLSGRTRRCSSGDRPLVLNRRHDPQVLGAALLKRLHCSLRANSGCSWTAWRTGRFDPERSFPISPSTGEERQKPAFGATGRMRQGTIAEVRIRMRRWSRLIVPPVGVRPSKRRRTPGGQGPMGPSALSLKTGN
jgi:hypothetical protein